MKTKPSLVFLFCCFIVLNASAQNTWVQKTNLTGIHRAALIAFSIDTVAYVGLGYNFSQVPAQQTDLWKYSPVTNSWTQVASKPGSGLSGATAFSIGSKGYVVSGFNASAVVVSELWEYDAVLNSWTQKTSCPCAGRDYAVAFSINGKGYFGTGYDASSVLFNDFWEYNPVTDSWLQRADVPGLPRCSAVGFSIGNYGYIGSGYIASGVNDFWRYNPQSNSWTQKADIGTQGISDGSGFAIGGAGYICTGYVNSATSGLLFEYDTITDTWTPMMTLTGPSRSNGIGFSIGNKGYISCGNDSLFTHLNDLWEYTPNSIVTSVSHQKYNTNTLSVFPAQASTTITIQFPAVEYDSRLTIININGEKLLEKTFRNGEILDVSSFAAGMYLVSIKSSAGNFAGRFIKE